MEINDNIKNILSKVDHTLLSVTAAWDEIRGICDDGIKYQTASVCIPPSFVKRAADYVQGRVKICTVIGFPNGYSTAEVKAYEAKCAVKDGADEIDMVINQGDLKEGRHATVLTEINRVKEACGDKILKVIIETCNLTDEEKVNMCRIVEQSDADFIKTSTGFGKNGATFEDIALFAENIKTKKIKAAGGIKSIADAEKFIELGADRLGTSRIVKIVKES
ncbi:MAG: deoxyribose-phosphate aldolase [Firmicutes bacterium]|nr:deoxyribose-phosphate aldolase [Bacillota bacterium]